MKIAIWFSYQRKPRISFQIHHSMLVQGNRLLYKSNKCSEIERVFIHICCFYLTHGPLAIAAMTAILKLAITRMMKKRNILRFPLINGVQQRISHGRRSTFTAVLPDDVSPIFRAILKNTKIKCCYSNLNSSRKF